MKEVQILGQPWTAPKLPSEIPFGDMPSDKVCINEEHISKANVIFPFLEKTASAVPDE